LGHLAANGQAVRAARAERHLQSIGGMKSMPKTTALLAGVCLGGAVVLGAPGHSNPSGPGHRTAAPGDPAEVRQVETGAHLYQTHCASCHGRELEGQANWREPLPDGSFPAPPHDASGHTWRHSDPQLFEATRRGNGSSMPGFEGVLSDAEIGSTFAYIKSRWPAELVARQRLMTRAAAARGSESSRPHGNHQNH
jgi:mono/diheme cytochrome c family protein